MYKQQYSLCGQLVNIHLHVRRRSKRRPFVWREDVGLKPLHDFYKTKQDDKAQQLSKVSEDTHRCWAKTTLRMRRDTNLCHTYITLFDCYTERFTKNNMYISWLLTNVALILSWTADSNNNNVMKRFINTIYQRYMILWILMMLYRKKENLHNQILVMEMIAKVKVWSHVERERRQLVTCDVIGKVNYGDDNIIYLHLKKEKNKFLGLQMARYLRQRPRHHRLQRIRHWYLIHVRPGQLQLLNGTKNPLLDCIAESTGKR